MLVPFVIDVESISPDSSWTPAQCRACHNSLLDIWKRVGLLTHDGNNFHESRLRTVVQQLPQKLRSLWQEVLERVPLRACGGAWNGVVEPSSLTLFSAAARLAIVDDARAEVVFGFAEECDELAVPVAGAAGSVDICRMLCASLASQFKTAQIGAGVHVEPGDTFQAVWNSRFRSLALAPIKRIAIVDRYAITKHHEPNAEAGLSGLERFLRLLDLDAVGPRHVSLFSAWTADLTAKTFHDVTEDVRLIMQRLPSRNIKRIRLCMVPNSAFRDDSHDRFVRFDDYVWDLGLGLEIFHGAFAAQRCAASFKSGANASGYRQIEQELSGHADAKAITIS